MLAEFLLVLCSSGAVRNREGELEFCVKDTAYRQQGQILRVLLRSRVTSSPALSPDVIAAFKKVLNT